MFKIKGNSREVANQILDPLTWEYFSLFLFVKDNNGAVDKILLKSNNYLVALFWR